MHTLAAEEQELDSTSLAAAPVVMAAVDRSPSGLSVARVASAFAQRVGGRVVFATVRQPEAPGTSSSARPHAVGLPMRTEVLVGEPAQRLIWLAQRERADFIVVGAGGDAQAHPLGRVYLALSRTAPCPVLIVPSGVDELPPRIGSVLCLMEGSEPALDAGRVATDLAERLRVHLSFRRLPREVNGDGATHGARVTAAARDDLAQLVVLEASPTGSGAAAPIGAMAAAAARFAEQPIVLVPPTTRDGAGEVMKPASSGDAPSTASMRAGPADSTLDTAIQQGEPDALTHPKPHRRAAGLRGSSRSRSGGRVRSGG